MALTTEASFPSTAPTLEEISHALTVINNIDHKEDFGRLSNVLVEKALYLSRAQSGCLLLVNKRTGELEITAVRNMPEEIITGYLQQPVRASAIHDDYEQGKNEFDYRPGPAMLNQLAAADYPYFYILPVRIGGKIIGYLTLSAGQPFLTTPDKRELFRLYLAYVAQAIESAYFIYQLQQQNAHLELMMTKLQNTQNHLKRAEKMALVGKLAASVAHEIRNPLTIIGTSLQLSFEAMAPDHQDRQLFETMLSNVRSVDLTVKELMNFARPVQLTFTSFPVDKALNRVLTFVSKKFEHKGVSITYRVPGDLPPVWMDEEQLQRVLINLLLNAYDHLEAHGEVAITVRHEPRQPWVQLIVADNGPGIAPEAADKIFEPFYTTRTQGSGLGLFMVKHLMEEMEGSIELDRQEPHGAVFVLRLPVKN